MAIPTIEEAERMTFDERRAAMANLRQGIALTEQARAELVFMLRKLLWMDIDAQMKGES